MRPGLDLVLLAEALYLYLTIRSVRSEGLDVDSQSRNTHLGSPTQSTKEVLQEKVKKNPTAQILTFAKVKSCPVSSFAVIREDPLLLLHYYIYKLNISIHVEQALSAKA